MTDFAIIFGLVVMGLGLASVITGFVISHVEARRAAAESPEIAKIDSPQA